MTKRDSSVFLPQVIDAWGGIENWVSKNRDAIKPHSSKYPLYYDSGRPGNICGWIMARLARDGRLTIKQANAMLYMAAMRYSGRPERTYEARRFEGMGMLVLTEDGHPVASFRTWDAALASLNAVNSAMESNTPHSDMQTRMLWRDGKYIKLKCCRWCDQPVQFKEHWKAFDGSVRCNRRDCRRMDYLQHKPKSRGGIDLTPRQRQAVNYEAWNTVKTINYLALVAKEQKRGRKSNHDVR